MLHSFNAWILDGLSTIMLALFAVEAVVRVYAMSAAEIRRALSKGRGPNEDTGQGDL